MIDGLVDRPNKPPISYPGNLLFPSREIAKSVDLLRILQAKANAALRVSPVCRTAVPDLADASIVIIERLLSLGATAEDGHREHSANGR